MDKTKKPLNKNACSVNFELTPHEQDLKAYFSLLLTSWNYTNVDSIISNVNIQTLTDTENFFRELFINIYRLGSQSEIVLKVDNVIAILDTVDTMLPELLIAKYNRPDDVLVAYHGIREKTFHECFERVRVSVQLYVETDSTTMFHEIQNILAVLTGLIGMRYFHSFVYGFANYLFHLYETYRDNSRNVTCLLLSALSTVSNRLVTFLLWKTDDDDYHNQSINKENRRDLAVSIFDRLKTDLRFRKFGTKEIVYVLNILDRRDRFIGQYVDAIPKNYLQNGYIVCVSDK